MIVTILVDNPKSWIMPFAERLVRDAQTAGSTATLIHDQKDLPQGNIAVFLACEKLVKPEVLKRNTYNLVVHESALPQGKGWSPLTWQILEGKNDITMTLFEAVDRVDAGAIYLQDILHFAGHELNDELKAAQGEMTIDLVQQFISMYPDVPGTAQSGEESSYPRRTPKDSELDPQKTLAEQFELLRVADNERYPVFFNYRGKKYLIKISKAEDQAPPR